MQSKPHKAKGKPVKLERGQKKTKAGGFKRKATRPTGEPEFIYSYTGGTDRLVRTSLVTGKRRSFKLHSYEFNWGCTLSELPGGVLLFTGGGDSKEAVSVDTRREFGVCERPSMLSARTWHAAVCHSYYLYVIGGRCKGDVSSYCERLICARSQWESLPPLPTPCESPSCIVAESTQSLYVLGGHTDISLDLIQRLCLTQLIWETLDLRLPHRGTGIACFKRSAQAPQIYFVMHSALYVFLPEQPDIRAVKALSTHIESWGGPSYYSNKTLYCSNCHHQAALACLEIGSLPAVVRT
jgi:hypothetical protein